MNTSLLPDHCDVEGCMVNNPDNFPAVCTDCIMLTMENIKDLPEEYKGELFFTYKSAIESGEYDSFIGKCCEEGSLTKEEYEEIETEIWNDILMENR